MLIILYTITIEILEKLSLALPFGARTRVAKKLNTTVQAVSKALKGKSKGDKALLIIEELYLEASNYKKTSDGLSETINAL